MFRTALILIIGGSLLWMIIRLLNTVKEITGDDKEDPESMKDRKIIDAEFEDIDKDK